MRSSRLPLLSLPLALVLALPSGAQQLAPVIEARHAQQLAPVARPRDTLPTAQREISPVGTILGGIGGGVVGTFAGFMIGAASAQGCHGEECSLGPILLGGILGESIGLAVGSHLGSRSSHHDRLVMTGLTSMVIPWAVRWRESGWARSAEALAR